MRAALFVVALSLIACGPAEDPAGGEGDSDAEDTCLIPSGQDQTCRECDGIQICLHYDTCRSCAADDRDGDRCVSDAGTLVKCLASCLAPAPPDCP